MGNESAIVGGLESANLESGETNKDAMGWGIQIESEIKRLHYYPILYYVNLIESNRKRLVFVHFWTHVHIIIFTSC